MLAFASPRRQNNGRRGVHLHVVFLHPSSFVSPALTPPTPHLPLCLTLLGYHPVGRQCARGSVQC